MPHHPDQRTVPWIDVDHLIDATVEKVFLSQRRYILGVTGPPGAGKSTLAARVTDAADGDVEAQVAPMDGFHLPNDELAEMGLADLKGVPDSFDAVSFIARLEAVRRGAGPVPWPRYDRRVEEVVEDEVTIHPATKLVIVEGNYLLLDAAPWEAVGPLLDEVWYLDVPVDVLVGRLERRHALHRTPAGAAAKVRSTDLPNTRLVQATRHRADVVIVL